MLLEVVILGVTDGLEMSVRDGVESNEGDAVMWVWGGACAGIGGVSNRDCCKLPGVIWELW